MNRPTPYPIHKLCPNELDAAFALIWTVFRQFVAPDYTQEGIDSFYQQFIVGQKFRQAFHTGSQTMYGSFDREKLVGVLSVSQNNHISCVFVDGSYHRKGIAASLFAKVIQDLKQRGAAKILLNASPFAVPFYHAIGFTTTGEESVYHGIRYTPMELLL